MSERVQATWRELVASFLGLPPARRVAIVSVGAASVALVVGLAWWVQRPLFPEPPRQDAVTIPAGVDPAGASSAALAYQAAVERRLADRIEGMLGAVVGHDRTIARVAATLDFARVERTEETYDPDRAVLRRQRTTREHATERRDERQSYEVSKVVARTVAPVGVAKQMSVAVLIDGTHAEREGEPVFTPRPPEELDRLKEIVKGAIGFSEARGDRIAIASVPFQIEGQGRGGVLSAWRSAPAVLVRLLAVGFAAAMLLHVVRPVAIAPRRGAAAGSGAVPRRGGGAAHPGEPRARAAASRARRPARARMVA
jgi:flagellar biosynthesis/type III secretory pathway M-ring protein FliF/YscJ